MSPLVGNRSRAAGTAVRRTKSGFRLLVAACLCLLPSLSPAAAIRAGVSHVEQEAPASAAQTAHTDSVGVLVAYYFHRTFRCETCILMEHYVRDVIDDDFAAETAQGRLRFKAFDYEDPANLDLVETYGLGDGPVLMLSKQCQGDELDHKELAAIWGRMEDPIGLLDLLRVEIAAALDTLGQGAQASLGEVPDGPGAAAAEPQSVTGGNAAAPPAESQTESSARRDDPSERATRGNP